jgi:hypothetical protein
MADIYKNINDILGKCPSKIKDNTYQLTYFGVMLSFCTGVFTLSGLISYTFIHNYRSYFSGIRKKMFGITNPFSFAFRPNWFGIIPTKK